MEYELNKIYADLTYEQYAEAEGLRSSDLHALRRSPAHYMANKLKPRTATPAMLFGQMFHKAVEHPARFRDLMRVKPTFVGKTLDGRDSTRSKEAKQKEEEWVLANKDAIILTQDEADRITGMLNAVSNHELLGNMLKGGVSEACLWVKDPATELTLKVRIDYLAVDPEDQRNHYVIDFKTAHDASLESFTWQTYGDKPGRTFYALTAAHYAHAVKLAGLGKGDHYVFVVIEPEAPFDIRVFTMDMRCIEYGESHRAPLTQRFANCLSADKWPGSPQKAEYLAMPEKLDYGRYPESEGYHK